MKDTFNVYNNEAFVCCVIQSLLSEMQKIDISRLFVITSLLLQDKMINDSSTKKYEGVLNYIKDNPIKFTSFPNIFEELLPIILNSLTLLCESSNIELDKQEIIQLKNDFTSAKSERLKQIKVLVPHVVNMVNNVPTEQILSILKVRL